MNRNPLENNLEKSHKTNHSDNFISNFLEELGKVVEKIIDKDNFAIPQLQENSIYVITDIQDEKLSLINIDNGQESDIYIATSKEGLQEFKNKEICYEMNQEDFYSLNLGDGIAIKNGACMPYHDKINIENTEVAAKLEDMYFCIEQEKNATYSVVEISDEKIYLTNTEEGGHFSIPKTFYPDFKVGDLLKNENGRYVIYQ